MAWNEPGGGKDPWGGNRGNDGPPDIDEALKKLAEKFQFFGFYFFLRPFTALNLRRVKLKPYDEAGLIIILNSGFNQFPIWVSQLGVALKDPDIGYFYFCF